MIIRPGKKKLWLPSSAPFYKAAGGGGGSVTWTKSLNPAASGTGGATTFTFSSLTLNSGITVVFVAAALGSPIASVTIGGVSAARAKASGASSAGGYCTEIWYATTTAGTGSVVVNTSVTCFGCNITGGFLTGSSGPTGSTAAVASSASSFGNPITTSAVTIPTGGVALAALATNQYGNGRVWNVGTEDYATSNGANLQIASGFISTTGTVTPSWQADYDGGIAVAVFGP